jgi:DNA-binding response OmpR family regulator
VTNTRTFLIAEDEAMIAMLLEDFLDLLGHKVAHMAASLDEGMSAIAAGGFDVAILDVNLGHEKCWPLAEALRAQGVPCLFATGGGDTIPAHLADVPSLAKPFTLASLEAALAGLD